MAVSAETVAIVNTSPDVVEMLRIALSHAGIVVVSCYTHDIRDGKIDFQAFLAAHDPKVVVYDVAPPYDRNWMLFEHVRRMPSMAGRRVILTTTNAVHIRDLVSPGAQVYEIVGKPMDLDAVVMAVREALKARPTA